MVDRIANPWGERTPFGQGEDWPVRVDQFLEEGISEEEVDRWVQTASILHSNGDAYDMAIKDGRIVGVRGRGVDRVNKGRLDPKDLYGWQANNSPDRLTRPLVRKNGKLVEASWDEAMDLMVERSNRLLQEKGPLAFGFYNTGQLFIEDYYTLGVIGKAGLGTPHMDGNTRLCTATSATAMKESFGTDGQPGSYGDINHADTIMHFGYNIAETSVVTWMRVLDRLEGPNPPKLIVVDPRATVPAKRADVHLAIKTGTNMALLNAFLYEIIENGHYEGEYVGRTHHRLRRAQRDGGGLHARVGGGDLRRPRRGDPRGGADNRYERASPHHGPGGRLPVSPGHGRRVPDKQHPPHSRHDRQARLRRPADERAAHRPEHPRVRGERRLAGL
jgi:hypothetical protein